MKATPKQEPRILKTFRLLPDVLKKLKAHAKKNNRAETEVIEQALYDFFSR